MKEWLIAMLFFIKMSCQSWNRHLGVVPKKFTCQRVNIPTAVRISSNENLGINENICVMVIVQCSNNDFCFIAIANSPITHPLELSKLVSLTVWVNNSCYWWKSTSHKQCIRIIGNSFLPLFYFIRHSCSSFLKKYSSVFTMCRYYIIFYLKMQRLKDFRKKLFFRQFFYKIFFTKYIT